MEVVEFKTRGRQSIELSCIKVLPKKAPKAVIQIFHGMGEHKERYIPFMKFLAENGYAVYAHDHRKHGKSVFNEEDYGIFTKEDTWSDIIDDCYFVSRKVMKDLPGVPLYILGHSLGSIIARSFLQEYPLIAKKAIIMGTLPPFSLAKALPPMIISWFLKVFTSKTKRSVFLANLLNKGMQPKNETPRTEFDWLSTDDAIVDTYIEDPLCGYAYTAQFYNQFFKGIVQVNKSVNISKTKIIPILFISGAEDPVGEKGVGVKDVFRQYTGHGHTQLTLELVKGARHEILNEVSKEATYKFILNWLNKSE